MKKLTFLFILALASVSAYADDQIISGNQIPTEITTFVSTHFPQATIAQAAIDRDDSHVTYDVTLSDGTDLEFNAKRQIIEIESRSALPASVIPAAIASYVKANYASNSITDWKKEGNKHKIELDNGLDLEFSKSGKFLRIDQ